MTNPADAPLDPLDESILERVGALHRRLDPPPDHLDELARFAVALERSDVEVARLTEEALVGSGARGEERTRTITFDSERRSIMVTVAAAGAGRVRVDGWLAPAARLRVELRLAGEPASSDTMSDDAGRFVFDDVPRGLAQLVLHPLGGTGETRLVTPSLRL